MEGQGQASADYGLRAVQLFLHWDRVGATAGLLLVSGAAIVLDEPLLWGIAVPILLLIIGLTVARRLLDSGRLFPTLLVIACGNWLVALVVAALVPMLWPVMIITVLMPLVLAAPFLDRGYLARSLGAAVAVAAAVAAVGLSNDDGGVFPDLADELELAIVVLSLIGHFAPIGLIVWQSNRLQRDNVDRAVALNHDLQASRNELAASRRRVVAAADSERRRIERDLHDGAQQRLVAVGVGLRLLESQTSHDPSVNEQVVALVAELDSAVEEVRELARGIYPPLLQSSGLAPALAAVARRSPLAITTALADVGRLAQSSESALYFTALEALANAAKHAPDSSVDLTLHTADGVARLVVADDGPGFDPDQVTATQGLQNMADRVSAVGGTLRIESAPGQGATIAADVPADDDL
jgi:signal transduction histidine kinase